MSTAIAEETKSVDKVMEAWTTGLGPGPLETHAVESEKTDAGGTPKPPANPSEKPTEITKPTDDDEGKWPRSAKDWDAFKAARKAREDALKSEVETHKAKVKEYEDKISKGISSPEFESTKAERDKLKQENEEYSNRLRVIDIQKHPKFERYFSSKTGAQIELAKRIVGPDKSEKVAKILQSPDGEWKDEQLEEMIADLPPLKQSQFGGIITQLALIKQERDEEIAKATENYEAMLNKEKSDREALVGRLKKMVDDTLTKAYDAKDGMPEFQKRENDAAWNMEVDKRVEIVRALVNGQVTPEVGAKAALRAAAYDAVVRSLSASRTEVEGLKTQIAELSKASPRLEIKSSGGATPPKKEIKSGSSPQEALGAWFSNNFESSE